MKIPIVVAILLASSQVSADTGIASVYRDYATACGERFDASAMTVAHPQGKTATMPCGTLLCLEFRDRRITVRVNDNGPHIKGRKIDMTPAVASALRFPGLGPVSFSKERCR